MRKNENEIGSYMYGTTLHLQCTHLDKSMLSMFQNNRKTLHSFYQSNKETAPTCLIKLKRARTKQLSLTLPNKGNKKSSNFAQFVYSKF